jgi:hypothetical protein
MSTAAQIAKLEMNMKLSTESLDKGNTWIITKVRKCLDVRGLLKNIVGIKRRFIFGSCP